LRSISHPREREHEANVVMAAAAGGWDRDDRHGFDGLVPSSGNIAPALWRDLFNASLDGKWEQVEELQRRLDTIARVFQRDRSLCQSLAALKACLEALGLCGPAVLPPIQTLDDAARLAIQRELAALDLVPVPIPAR